jgi:hypothetical protein
MEILNEEELLLLGAFQELSRLQVPESEEGRIAAIYDRYASGKAINPDDVACVLALASSLNRLKSATYLPVPEALTAAVERYFEAEKKARERKTRKEKEGSILVRLGAGLELVSSTLLGLEPVFVAVTPTRRSGAEPARRLTMNESLETGGFIEYSILRSGENKVMISLLFQDLKEPVTVLLSENGRPISSRTVRDAAGRIHFDGLTPGEYTIAMSGSMERSFTIRLLGPSDPA